jgi:hypothetical protein
MENQENIEIVKIETLKTQEEDYSDEENQNYSKE